MFDPHPSSNQKRGLPTSRGIIKRWILSAQISMYVGGKKKKYTNITEPRKSMITIKRIPWKCLVQSQLAKTSLLSGHYGVPRVDCHDFHQSKIPLSRFTQIHSEENTPRIRGCELGNSHTVNWHLRVHVKLAQKDLDSKVFDCIGNMLNMA